ELLEPRAHLRVLPLRFGRKHDGAAAAQVDQFVDDAAEILQEVDAAPVKQLDVRLVEPARREEALILRSQNVCIGRLLKADDARKPCLDRFNLRGAEVLADQDGET